ncbi:hypothetical protein RF11_07430 [Thelohanellus kitauei]|uniref:Uncharacterized protein n=1 Tax=Thelohanellus kitauei TaxID=669202 RepID=A0A0C2JZ48_THEKT|nr:hypothetical protein RF11_07430 [Thelohanellus kitauei]
MSYPNTDVAIEADQTAIDRYTNIDPLSDVSIQMEAVRRFISWFKNKNNPKVDGIFIDRFPKKLYKEFVRIKDDGNTVEGYSEKRILFFDVFTYIFRNDHMIWESEAQPFINLFLRLIQTRDDISAYNPESLMSSIIICVLNPSNKVSFIKYNCMYHFYHNLIKESTILTNEFWKMCAEVYELDISHTSLYFRKKITYCLDQIMTTFLTTRNDDMTSLLFMVLEMLHLLKLLVHIRFDLNSFFSITDSIINNHINIQEDCPIIDQLPKIWIDILNQNPITFQIDDIHKLTLLSGLLSIDMFHHLSDVLVSGRMFEATMNNSKKLYIIYLVLISLNQNNSYAKSWLVQWLTYLHQNFQEYLTADLILVHPFEHQFLILQYYIKSYSALELELSSRDYQVIYGFLDRRLIYPALGLHRLYLISQILNETFDRDLSDEFYPPNFSMKILEFMKDLILALSGDMYNQKLRTEKQLFMYEFIKINCLSNINVDFVRSIFSRCRSDLTGNSRDWIPQKLGLSEYKIHNHIFGFILNNFNILTYFEKHDRDHFMKWCAGNYTNLSEIPNNHEQFGVLTALRGVSYIPR